ncbi:deoxyribodipyrimidine photolyase [Melioribacter roseus P3M-2]|uniref:Deoxyribodipyrimidine photo-lyase n=1 Tax=Melioribacter roseus (strain DSM 23840 / JCM 17771 / VKM B-2668 / P3M-2) TaxID=1191523 RepID=I6ZRF9_MELRP|nr:deoxyribodipyrimidine photo-lyase [Melioribacter roseus]AFN74659.1 deoxyribodipyrimidine photolyase [Melioribacter roseus P3M-2]
MVLPKRVRKLKDAELKNGAVIYWMQRDQRVYDNWALLFAYHRAKERQLPLIVIFNLVPEFLGASLRQYSFMINGLKQVEKKLSKLNIGFKLLSGNPAVTIPAFVKESGCSELITDFNPLRITRKWKKEVHSKIKIPFYDVDAHNIVPCFLASGKQEFAAYTFRPKIQKLLPEFMDDFPPLKKMPVNEFTNIKNDWENLKIKTDASVQEIDWILPGEEAAFEILDSFIESKLEFYSDKKNDPNENALSNLSIHLHFGHISAQRIALEILRRTEHSKSRESFLEELIVRKELSDNFCYYNKKYDSFEGFPEWAQKTLNEHRRDKREYVYSLEELEEGKTHDSLWNAAQFEMKTKGKMHGYLRMYWAKKILEWTNSPEEALKYAIYLNDKHELDGRDPNGYTGIAWSIGGVHDRAWSERPVFGKIRYMNYAGCKRKFDVSKYTINVFK